MHLLATTGAELDDLEQAVDLAQSPAEMVVLSFSDSDLSALAEAWTAAQAELPSLRLASLKRLKHPMSVDLYLDRVVAASRAVVVRCLGGLDYWRYGLEHLVAMCRSRGILAAGRHGRGLEQPRSPSADRPGAVCASSARGRRASAEPLVTPREPSE